LEVFVSRAIIKGVLDVLNRFVRQVLVVQSTWGHVRRKPFGFLSFTLGGWEHLERSKLVRLDDPLVALSGLVGQELVLFLVAQLTDVSALGVLES
jgi:hypothetical protein